MPKYVVGPLSDFPPGVCRPVSAGGRSIAVYNVDGTLYALFNRCPHQGGPLAAGTIVGWLAASSPGQYEYDSAHKFVKCPWHGWEFDLATGQSWVDPERSRVRPYPVNVESGVTVMAGIRGPAGAVPGPYRAESIPIHIEDDYVVVELAG